MENMEKNTQLGEKLIFQIILLFEEEPITPFPEDMLKAMAKYFGAVEKTKNSENMHGFYLHDYAGFIVDEEAGENKKNDEILTSEDAIDLEDLAQEEEIDKEKIPFLMMTYVEDFHGGSVTEFERKQMWDVYGDQDELLNRLKHQVVGMELNTNKLPLDIRMNLLMDYMEAMLLIYPEAEAVYFPSAGKLIRVEDIKANKASRDERFLSYAMNVRIFRQSTGVDYIVDTIGLLALDLPDVQYHFNGLNPVDVVRHAYMMARHIIKHNNPFKDGDYVNHITPFGISEDKEWQVYFELSMVQPVRLVLDVYTDEFASGTRSYEGEEVE